MERMSLTAEMIEKRLIGESLAPIRHFHPGLCSKCLKLPSDELKMKACSQCQLVSYCSKSCQKSDWKVHRPFCTVNAIQSGKNIFSGAVKEVKNKENWISFRTSLQIAATVNLNRPLEPFEQEILWFPQVCEVCKVSDRSKLTGCPICHSVFYCSEEHLLKDIDNHAKWCGRYHTCTYIDGFIAQRGSGEVPFPIIIAESYKPLAMDMSSFLYSELSFLRKDGEKISEITENTLNFETAQITFNILISERMTDPLSVLYALEKFLIGNDKQKISDATKITVHVVGAERTREILGINRWEYLMHHLPLLKVLQVAFIGPLVLPPGNEPVSDGYVFHNGEKFLCEECQKNKKIVVEEYHMLYHKCAERGTFSKPDVIVAFNCGFHEFYGLGNDTWPESLDLMLSDPSIPVIFTSYTKGEAQKDLQAVTHRKDVTVSIATHPNPFKSLKPLRDFHSDDDSPIFYVNQYMTCVNGKKII